MDITTNYTLKKPGDTDGADIGAISDDMDIIDTELKKSENHRADTVAHVTQADHDKINGAVQSATIGGDTVSKSGTALQFPAYPTSLPANGGHASSADNATYATTAGSAPANGGTANYAHYSSHAVGSSGAALRNNTATVGGGPSGGSDGDGWDICT